MVFVTAVFRGCEKSVNYQVVASFVVQDETTMAITEVLRIIKSWAPE